MREEYRFDTYWRNERTSEVVISADRKTVQYTIFKKEIPMVPYLFENPTVEQMYDFLETRCMPKQRTQLQEYLDDLGLDEYDPWKIVKITHGVMWEDYLWLKFPGENITWKDVKVRD